MIAPSLVTANSNPLTPLRFLERSASVFPERTAVIHGDRRYSYRQFGAEVMRFAQALHARIEPGDRVAFLAPNVPELLFAHFAVPLAGGVLVALNSRLAGAELAYILEHSGATVLLVDGELAEVAGTIAGGLPALREVIEVPDSTVGHTDTRSNDAITGTYAELLASADEALALEWDVADENTVISINYTSGTTGNPKGVMYTHRAAYLNAFGETFHNGFTGATQYLWTLPMFHCNGWCTAWAVTLAGGTQVCLRAVRADAVWDAIEQLGVTNLCGAPTVCTTIATSPRAHRVPSLQITTAGAPPSPTVIAQLAELGITVVHVYGLTESYGPYTVCEVQEQWAELPDDQRAQLLSRQGVAMVHAAPLRVVGPEMEDVAADGQMLGEIVLRGNNVMAGYYRDEQATADAFRGGWFHTGDLGVMHPDGYIQLRDRAKDIIISGGENISTIEVEQAIVAHPAVLEAAVIGVPSERWGERPKAFVVTKPKQTVTPDELRAFLAERIAKFKIPDEFVFPLDLPRTPTGKVLKFELREQTGSLADRLSTAGS